MDNLTSIKEYQKAGAGEMIKDYFKDYFKLGWTFNTWYEKIILFIITVLAIWKIAGWIL